MTEVTPEGTSQINYTYDNLYRLTHETRTGVNSFTASYAYDINSNRTQKVETVNGITETINYEYNANDQLLSEVSSANGTTIYTYDVNGSLTTKANEGKFSYQYGYDLRNRLATANITRKEGTADVTITSSYAYNADGIRTRALQTINGITQNRYFLLDEGHTGYAQVFEETSTLGGNIARSYIIGDDVLSQTVAGVTSHLLYDGHGSTRQLINSDGGVTANYAYDAYGKMLGGNPGVTDGKQSATDLLYAGEQFDPGLQMEYLRARYYDQDNGRFNRLDPFDGNSEDPQSLHKYAYAHCDPINGIDPSGNFTILELLIVVSVSVTIFSLAAPLFFKARRSYGVYIGPDITEWLYNGMKFVANRAKDNPNYAFLAKNGGRWNTWNLPRDPSISVVPYSHMQSHVIAGKVVPDDVGGNIMLGCRVALSTLQSISNAGDIASKKSIRGDEPEDQAAIKLGMHLYQANRDDVGDINWNVFTLQSFRRQVHAYKDERLTDPTEHLVKYPGRVRLVAPPASNWPAWSIRD